MDLVDDHRPRQHRRRPRAAEPAARRHGLHHGRGGVVLAAGARRDASVEVHFGVWGMTETAHRDAAAAARQRVRGGRLAALRRRASSRSTIRSTSIGASCRSTRYLALWSTSRPRSRRATARCCRRTTSSAARAGAVAARSRARPSAAATRTRCAASARRGPRRPGRTREEFLANVAAGRGRGRRRSWRHAAARGGHLWRHRAGTG